MKKTIVILLTLVLTLCLSVGASADATELSVTDTAFAASEEGAEPTAPTELPTAQESIEGTDVSAQSTYEPTQTETVQEHKNLFAALYEFASAHTAEIFSALAAILSCVIAFAYRRGLLPLLKQGIGSLAGTVGGMDKATEAAREQMLTEARDNRQLTAQITKSVELLSKEVGEVLSRFDTLKNEKEERELLLSTLESEVELLGEIFLSSSLPEYRKQIVGNTVARLKEQLATRKGA